MKVKKMDEAISKQKVIDKLDEALERITKNVSKESDAYHIVYGTVDVTKCMIMTIQPKKGKWLYQIGMVKCDQCLRAIRRIDHDGLLNFCPNCGAKMEVNHESN